MIDSVNWMAARIQIVNDDDLTEEIDLGKRYETLNVYVPTLTSANLTVYVAEAKGGDYVALGNGVTVTAGTGAFWDIWDIGGHQFLKIGTSAGQAADRMFRVMGVRS